MKTSQTRNRSMIAITLDPSVLAYIDKTAKDLGLTRSRMIENVMVLAVDDLKMLKKLGMIDALRLIRGFQNKVKKERRVATR